MNGHKGDAKLPPSDGETDGEKHFAKAHLTFDKFHVLKVLNEAVDKV
ncbi:MAG: transposase, partial [Proteobacteria bacterium]|nr:transposase [Pseudomonadota bacterium]